MICAYIAIGSNLGSPLQQATSALNALAQLPDSQIQAVSSFYRTAPFGALPQPDYLNAAVALLTSLDAHTLLHHLQTIETRQGRVRNGERWTARTLDLDIMLFGDQQHNSNQLTIPHYDLYNRAFMLLPLADITPDQLLPNGKTVKQALAALDSSDISHW